ncbi:MAG: hypothetical protein KGR47_05360 [Acidobacteria bacterium]|nr:hypothetical protein [Acidobacteriota bacterium]
MNATIIELHTGDVVEIGEGENTLTALVLLGTDEFAVLDPCDGNVPFVVRNIDLHHVRVFDDIAV